MGLSTWEIEPGEGHTDHVAEATIFGTAITQFHRSTRGAEPVPDLPAPQEEPLVTADPTQLGIPEDAMRRLAEMRPGQATSLFTSDLSVNEFLLVREAGFRPLGLVLGLEHLPRRLPVRAGGTRTRSSTRSRRPCTTRGSWR